MTYENGETEAGANAFSFLRSPELSGHLTGGVPEMEGYSASSASLGVLLSVSLSLPATLSLGNRRVHLK